MGSTTSALGIYLLSGIQWTSRGIIPSEAKLDQYIARAGLSRHSAVAALVLACSRPKVRVHTLGGLLVNLAGCLDNGSVALPPSLHTIRHRAHHTVGFRNWFRFVLGWWCLRNMKFGFRI